MIKKSVKPTLTAREKFEAMVNGRQAKMAERTIVMETGTVLYKAAIAQILPWIERADPYSRMDFAMFVTFNDRLETAGGRELQKELAYKRGNPLWDKSVSDIIDCCVELTLEGQIIFNSALVMDKLEPEEREAIRYAVGQQAGLKSMLDSWVDAHPRNNNIA